MLSVGVSIYKFEHPENGAVQGQCWDGLFQGRDVIEFYLTLRQDVKGVGESESHDQEDDDEPANVVDDAVDDVDHWGDLVY